jgi:myo-inositol-1(or 4)-monophosphatase
MMVPDLIFLKDLARQAGSILREGYVSRPGYGHQNEVKFKGAIDLVTEVDHKSEAFLLGEIKRRFPDHKVVAEESGRFKGEGDFTWYIDPLDGTVNFAYGIPAFCLSIAVAKNGRVQAGVVYDPLRDECFCSAVGEGAWLNDQPIRVGQAAELNKSLLVTGFPYDIRTTPDNNLDNFARFSLHSMGVRRMGAAALDICYVAAGRFDGYWETYVEAWDVAAGILIASEAGAKVTHLDGLPFQLKGPGSILAANPVIHDQMLEVVKFRP